MLILTWSLSSASSYFVSSATLLFDTLAEKVVVYNVLAGSPRQPVRIFHDIQLQRRSPRRCRSTRRSTHRPEVPVVVLIKDAPDVNPRLCFPSQMCRLGLQESPLNTFLVLPPNDRVFCQPSFVCFTINVITSVSLRYARGSRGSTLPGYMSNSEAGLQRLP